MLATLTPSEYALIRPFLATSSGFQSYQYRAVEFMLGNKNRDMVAVFDHDPTAQGLLQQALGEPSVYDEFLRYLGRRGYAIPQAVLDRDVTQPYRMDAELVDVFAGVYADPAEHWGVYETCEELVDIEDNFQNWRFRHLQVVTRTIGHKVGTGGSRASTSCAGRSTSPSSPSCMPCAPGSGASALVHGPRRDHWRRGMWTRWGGQPYRGRGGGGT